MKKKKKKKSEGSNAGASKKRKASRGGGGGAAAAASGEGKPKRVKRVWTESQEELLTKAVEKLGAGKWKEMVNEFDFEGKESKVLKDKWRTMSRRLKK